MERIGVRASLSGEVSHGFRELIESVGWRLGSCEQEKKKIKIKIKRKVRSIVRL